MRKLSCMSQVKPCHFRSDFRFPFSTCSNMRLIQGISLCLLLVINFGAFEALEVDTNLASQCRFFPFHPSCRGHMSKRGDPSASSDYFSVDQFQYNQDHPQSGPDSKAKLISLLKMLVKDSLSKMDPYQPIPFENEKPKESKHRLFPTLSRDRSSSAGKYLSNLLHNFHDDELDDQRPDKSYWTSG